MGLFSRTRQSMQGCVVVCCTGVCCTGDKASLHSVPILQDIFNYMGVDEGMGECVEDCILGAGGGVCECLWWLWGERGGRVGETRGV